MLVFREVFHISHEILFECGYEEDMGEVGVGCGAVRPLPPMRCVEFHMREEKKRGRKKKVVEG